MPVAPPNWLAFCAEPGWFGARGAGATPLYGLMRSMRSIDSSLIAHLICNRKGMERGGDRAPEADGGGRGGQICGTER